MNLRKLYCKRIGMSNITVISCQFSVFRLRKYKMIQLTNETIYRSANQKNNLPIYQSANHPIKIKNKIKKQSTNQRKSTNQPIFRSANQKNNLPIGQSANQNQKQSTYQILNMSLNHLFVWQFLSLLHTFF